MTGDNPRIIIGVHQDQTLALHEVFRMSEACFSGQPIEHRLAAVTLTGPSLSRTHILGHHHHCPHLGLPRRIGQGLPVITTRARHYPPMLFRGGELQDSI